MRYIFINDVNHVTRTVFEKEALFPQFATRWCWSTTHAHRHFIISRHHVNNYICRCDVLKLMRWK